MITGGVLIAVSLIAILIGLFDLYGLVGQCTANDCPEITWQEYSVKFGGLSMIVGMVTFFVGLWIMIVRDTNKTK